MQVGSLKPCMRFGKTEVVNSMYQTVEKGRPKALVYMQPQTCLAEICDGKGCMIHHNHHTPIQLWFRAHQMLLGRAIHKLRPVRPAVTHWLDT